MYIYQEFRELEKIKMREEREWESNRNICNAKKCKVVQKRKSNAIQSWS